MIKAWILKHLKDILIFVVPTLISIVALFQSSSSNKLAEEANQIASSTVERTRYDDIPSFDIVHNIWSDNPHYILYNESSKKLAHTPHPSYLMFIPSKLYWADKTTDQVQSNLILSPISYDKVIEQIREPSSIGKIETSYLPKSFFGRKGERDVITDSNLEFFKEGKDYGLETFLRTYPFLVIVSKIDYQYFDNDEIYTDYIISTPLGKSDITEGDYQNILSYTRDNAFLEVTDIAAGKSVYKIASDDVAEHLNSLKEYSDKLSMIGGVEGGYDFVLKKINQLITPEDPLYTD